MLSLTRKQGTGVVENILNLSVTTRLDWSRPVAATEREGSVCFISFAFVGVFYMRKHR